MMTLSIDVSRLAFPPMLGVFMIGNKQFMYLKLLCFLNYYNMGLIGATSRESSLWRRFSPSSSSSTPPLVGTDVVRRVSSAPLRTYHTSFLVRRPCKTPRSVKSMYRSPNFWKYDTARCKFVLDGSVSGVWSIHGLRSSVLRGSASA